MAAYDVVGEGLGFTEGPVWTKAGLLLVTSITHGVIYDVSGGRSRVLVETGGGPNGMTEAGDGSLYVANNGSKYKLNGQAKKKAAAGIQVIENTSVRHVAEHVDAPNDLCFGPDGRLYFTDPRGWTLPEDVKPGRIYAMTREGKLDLLTEGLKFSNGIAFGTESTQLFVAETYASRVLVYPITFGKLGEAREFCRIEPGMPDGICFDANGLLYVAATEGNEVQVFDRDGKCIERLHCGDDSMPTNCCFGGKTGKTLFVTDSRGERVLAFELDVKGLPLYPYR
ncbi:MAG: SMP-30/gluconolactonase/LRE family protein [Dehalococcoidia bacterium]